MKTIKQYKQQVKSLKEQYECNNAWGTRWMNYANDLNAKLDAALKRLETISKGHYYTEELSADTENKSEKTAIIGLRKISRMQERKP